ncbi:MAG TPA: UvrD-helicase domain-containing protein [Thermoflexales bacterium]|nr:UvrD-helicase domain-containing protein [Thermoflexales bacterium]
MSNASDEIVSLLAGSRKPVCVTAAAGCGKTEAIVKAVAQSQGKQLILTHTHAGIAALRSRLRKHQVPDSKYQVETIAGWLAKYTCAYSSMSEFAIPMPYEKDWSLVYPAAIRLFAYPFIQHVLCATYSGVFVDEYQDCSAVQHELIKTMAQWLPVRVLGDPLQAIFDFGNEKLVDWQNDVLQFFSPLPELQIPYRWKNANKKLGDELISLRKELLVNQLIDLTNYPEVAFVGYSNNAEAKQILKCQELRKKGGSCAGVFQCKDDDHRLAKKLQGAYQSLETIDCIQLIQFASNVDKWLLNDDPKKKYKAIESEVRNILLASCGNKKFLDNSLSNELSRIRSGDLSAIVDIAHIAIHHPDAYLARKELLVEVEKSAKLFESKKYAFFREAALFARQATRIKGRKIENQVISRTRLIKGLEFDHAIVLDADSMSDKQHFYVAMTRGSMSLTVISSSPIIGKNWNKP